MRISAAGERVRISTSFGTRPRCGARLLHDAPRPDQWRSLFFDPIAAGLRLSRGQIALAYTFGTLAGAPPASFVGRWIDRRRPRRAVETIAVAGLACAVMALTWSTLTLAMGFAALRGATIGGLSLVSQHVINLLVCGPARPRRDRGEHRSCARRRRLSSGDRRVDPSWRLATRLLVAWCPRRGRKTSEN